MLVTRPMLCATVDDTAALRYPLLATPKLDGIRALVVGGRAVSRAFKPIRNRAIARWMEAELPEGADGELTVPGASFQDVQSAVMSYDGDPGFVFHCFDVASDKPYCERLADVERTPTPLLPVEVATEADLLRYEEQCLADGHEGVCLRAPRGPYKCGRSSLREGYLMKLKRMLTSEAVVLSLVEQMQNNNPVERNAFGLARRPGGRGAHTPKGTMGALAARDVHTGVLFECGTGFAESERQHIWDRPDLFVGRVFEYKYQGVGSKDRPRFPAFLRWREL